MLEFLFCAWVLNGVLQVVVRGAIFTAGLIAVMILLGTVLP